MPTLLYMLQKNSTRPESVLKPGLPSKRSLPVLYLWYSNSGYTMTFSFNSLKVIWMGTVAMLFVQNSSISGTSSQ